MKENMAVAIYNQIKFPVLEIWHQLDLFTSMHHFIILVVSLLSSINSLLRSKKQEESSPNKRTILTCENEEISKMEDRLHVHRIRAKQWPNDRQYLIQLGTHGLLK
jgi:hypothetical protein